MRENANRVKQNKAQSGCQIISQVEQNKLPRCQIIDQVDSYLDYCEKVRRMSPTTMRAKRNILERFMMITRVDDLRKLDNETFNTWVANLSERGVAPQSINTYNAAVLAMVRYYRGIGVNIPLQEGLIGKLREGTVRRRFYTFTEIEVAISRADFTTALMIKIMFETGMRIAELVHLRVSDFVGRRIQFIGKGRKPREVYIREDTLYKVQEYLKWRGTEQRTNDDANDAILGKNRGDKYLFATLNGEPPTVATIRKRMKQAFLSAGLDGFYPHALRHSFATNLQLKGASVEEIKEMMGHESIATTERYLHGFEGRLEELFDKYG